MKKILFTILLLPLFISAAYAENINGEAAEIIDAFAVEEPLNPDERQISGELKTDGTYDVRAAMERLRKSVIEKIRGELHDSVRFATALLGTALLFHLSDALCSGTTAKRFCALAACSAAAVKLLSGMDSIVVQTVGALTRISDYSNVSLPVLFTSAAACGSIGSAAAKYAAVCLALNVMSGMAQRVIIPLVYVYIALSLTNCLFPNSVLANMGRLAKWLTTTILTALTITFCGYISMTGLLSGSVDAAALKTAKTVMSTVLPVVGGIASDASSAVIAAANVIKNSIGIFGLISVCAICAGPFAMLSVKMLVLKAVAAVCEMMPDSSLSRLISETGNAVGLLLALLGCSGIMLFISITAGIRVVTA